MPLRIRMVCIEKLQGKKDGRPGQPPTPTSRHATLTTLRRGAALREGAKPRHYIHRMDLPPAAPTSAPPHDPYAALALPSFRWFVASLLTMTMATQVQAVVVGWLIYQVTRDPFALGLVGLAEVVPYIGVALFAGYLVDRYDRKRISAIALVVLLAASVALWLIALVSPASTRIWPYYAVLSVCGVARAFLQSSRSALVSEIVPRALFPNAATWRSSTWQLGTVLGPALGGLMFAALGARFTF
ncbi:MAG: MFS transporter, partial [Gemmatimonadaceae bacterium]|nr:MFS transporter [Gemmatimonadaceae bacterium]